MITCLYPSLVSESTSPHSDAVKPHLLEVILNQFVPSTPALYIIAPHILTIALTLAASHFQPICWQNEVELPVQLEMYAGH